MKMRKKAEKEQQKEMLQRARQLRGMILSSAFVFRARELDSSAAVLSGGDVQQAKFTYLQAQHNLLLSRRQLRR